MNITFLIGNGFDLNCGLKSRYTDVYKRYCALEKTHPAVLKFQREIGDNHETWAAFEERMAEYMQEFDSEMDFLECLRDFKHYLNEYLKDQVDEFGDRIARDNSIKTAAALEMQSSITTFFDGISHDVSRKIKSMIGNSNIRYSFIIFNYTTIFEDIFKSTQLSKNADFIHIHGTIDDDLVLGMDNDQQLPQVKYDLTDSGKRAFLKTVFNSAFDSHRVARAEDAISNSDIICIFGMSMGCSDETWKNKVLDWLAKEDAQLFYYDFACSRKSYRTIDERMDIEDRAKGEFLENNSVSSYAYTELFPKIHIPCGKNIFNIDDAIREATEAFFEQERKKEALLEKLRSSTTITTETY